jgi:hypothetical protein
MAAKLKSILRQIHWSLVLRSAIFALAWFLFPFWLFFLIALYLYFVPLFQSQKLAMPFFVLLVLTYIEPQNFLFLLIFAILFYCLLLIKDLLLIDRKSAYEFIIFVLAFFLFRDFYERFGAGIITGNALWYGFLVAVLIGFLVGGFLRVFSSPKDTERYNPQVSQRVATWLTFLLVWQFLILGLFLPLDFVYQSVIIFLIAVVVIDFIPEYYFGGISRQKLLTAGTAIFALLVVALTSVQWRL